MIDVAHLASGIGGLEAVFGGRHVADLPGTVHFITETPVLNAVRFGDAVLAAQIAPMRSFFHVAVFNQGSGLFRGSRAKIQTYQRRSAHRATPGNKFVGAELIGLDGVPGLFQHTGTIFSRSHTIQPMVAGDEVASGIANDGNSQVLYFFQDILAKPVRIRELGVWVVNTPVNRAAKMLEEGAKEVPVEGREGATGIEIHARGAGARCLGQE